MSAPEVVTLGETMALLTTAAGERLRHTSSLHLSVGGSESNVAVGLRRLGRTVAWCGRVGDDELGARVVRDLRAEGVVVHAVVDPTRPTGLMVKERRSSESTRVAYYRRASAGSALEPGDLDDDLVAGARVLHLTGITPGLSPSAAATVAHAVELAHRSGTVVSLDLNHREAVWAGADYRTAMRELVAASHIVFGSAHEVTEVTGPVGADPATAVRALASLGPRWAVLTLGADGAVAAVDDVVHRTPAFAVDVVDTVGAGDAFVAGWLSAWLADPDDIDAAMTRAAACGALACTSRGDWEGAATPADVAGLLTGHVDVVQR